VKTYRINVYLTKEEYHYIVDKAVKDNRSLNNVMGQYVRGDMIKNGRGFPDC